MTIAVDATIAVPSPDVPRDLLEPVDYSEILGEIDASVYGRGTGIECAPARRVADAVLTQAFRDLHNHANARSKRKQRYYDSAKDFLLGESPEGLEARTFYCDTLGVTPAYVERMAYAIMARAHD